jgi:hypothetical protein
MFIHTFEEHDWCVKPFRVLQVDTSDNLGWAAIIAAASRSATGMGG